MRTNREVQGPTKAVHLKLHDFKHPFKHQASLQAPSYTTSFYAFHRLRINWEVQATTKTPTGMSETKKRSRSQ